MIDSGHLKNLYHSHIESLARAYGGVLEIAQYDSVFIHSGAPTLRSSFDDQYWPLRVTPAFAHWLPLAAADSLLHIVPGQKPILYFLTQVDFWETQVALERIDDRAATFWRTEFAVVPITKRADFANQVVIGLGHHAYVGEPAPIAKLLPHTNPANVNPAALCGALDHLRSQKSPYEVACIREANRLAARGHSQVANLFLHENISELDLHLRYLQATAQDDPETPYKNIVAIGRNAATLHHVSYSRVPGEGSTSLLLDAGATFHGYASDITRTHIKGKNSRFSELLSGVETLQQKLCSRIELGMLYEDLHDQAHQEVAALLCAMKISRMSVEETMHSGTSRAFFPHGLGHSLGLQCHDVGCADTKPRVDNPFLRNTSKVAPGQVFTIEPGIYFIQSLLDRLRQQGNVRLDWSQVDELTPYGGIRIEDDVHILTGEENQVIENLTRSSLLEARS